METGVRLLKFHSLRKSVSDPVSVHGWLQANCSSTPTEDENKGERKHE